MLCMGQTKPPRPALDLRETGIAGWASHPLGWQSHPYTQCDPLGWCGGVSSHTWNKWEDRALHHLKATSLLLFTLNGEKNRTRKLSDKPCSLQPLNGKVFTEPKFPRSCPFIFDCSKETELQIGFNGDPYLLRNSFCKWRIVIQFSTSLCVVWVG